MSTRKRKRGVKASREKLESIMAQRGIKTQRELAQKIARNENIENIPKDLVNKVFREQAVSFQNLARIARALDVEAHTIYLAGSDQTVTEVLNEQSAESELQVEQSTSPNPKRNRYIALLLLSVVGVLWYLLTSQSPKESPAASAPSTKLSSPIGKVLIVVQATPAYKSLAVEVAAAFESVDGVNLIVPETPSAYELSIQQALARWQAHGVLRFTSNKGQYYQHIKLAIHSKEHHAVLAQWFIRESELTSSYASLVEIAKQQLVNFVDGTATNPVSSRSDVALDAYLRGIDTLYLSHSLDSYAEAKAHFENAVAADTSFAPAYAKLCLVKVRESWIEDEIPSLEEAAIYCHQAEALAPTSIETLVAKTELLARTGELDKALEIADALLSQSAKSADTYATLAEVYLAASGKRENANNEADIVRLANRAKQLDPSHWRASNTLSNYYFGQGDIRAAKKNLEDAARVVDHEVILANLGTMQLCFDELDEAAATYQTIINTVDDNYLGHENLGTVYLMQHNFDQALAEKQRAITLQPDIAIHQVWAGLAQTNALSGNSEEAFKHYAHALSLLERDELIGNATVNDKLHKLYYQVKLNELNPKTYPFDSYTNLVGELIEQQQNLGLKERSHLAWLAGKIGDEEAKSELIQAVSAICPVYLRSPELTGT